MLCASEQTLTRVRELDPFDARRLATMSNTPASSQQSSQCTGHGVNALASSFSFASRRRRSPKSPAVLQLLRQLDLPGTASKAQIRAAYLRRVKVLHPDVAGKSGEEHFRQLKEDYEHAMELMKKAAQVVLRSFRSFKEL